MEILSGKQKISLSPLNCLYCIRRQTAVWSTTSEKLKMCFLERYEGTEGFLVGVMNNVNVCNVEF